MGKYRSTATECGYRQAEGCHRRNADPGVLTTDMCGRDLKLTRRSWTASSCVVCVLISQNDDVIVREREHAQWKSYTSPLLFGHMERRSLSFERWKHVLMVNAHRI